MRIDASLRVETDDGAAFGGSLRLDWHETDDGRVARADIVIDGGDLGSGTVALSIDGRTMESATCRIAAHANDGAFSLLDGFRMAEPFARMLLADLFAADLISEGACDITRDTESDRELEMRLVLSDASREDPDDAVRLLLEVIRRVAGSVLPG